jgi:(p)ppGpp synthase/HD superfamily hydrolase
MNESDEEKLLLAATMAMSLHGDVTYGGGLSMMDQVLSVVDFLYEALEGDDDVPGVYNATSPFATQYSVTDLIVAGFLHKSFEAKRIHEDAEPIDNMRLEELFGEDVAAIVGDLASEPPEPDNLSKEELWAEKADWAACLLAPAQMILLAEKAANFETSRDKPNPSWPLSRHQEYYETRMLMVERIKDASPTLYDVAVKIRDEGLEKIAQMNAEAASSDSDPETIDGPPKPKPPA